MAKRILLGLLTVGLLLAATAAQAQEVIQRIALQRSLPLAPSNIAVMYIDGKSPRDLIPQKDTAGRRVTPALSPDGQTLCFSEQVGNHYQLFLWRLDETNTAVGSGTLISYITYITDRQQMLTSGLSPWGQHARLLARIPNATLLKRTAICRRNPS